MARQVDDATVRLFWEVEVDHASSGLTNRVTLADDGCSCQFFGEARLVDLPGWRARKCVSGTKDKPGWNLVAGQPLAAELDDRGGVRRARRTPGLDLLPGGPARIDVEADAGERVRPLRPRRRRRWRSRSSPCSTATRCSTTLRGEVAARGLSAHVHFAGYLERDSALLDRGERQAGRRPRGSARGQLREHQERAVRQQLSGRVCVRRGPALRRALAGQPTSRRRRQRQRRGWAWAIRRRSRRRPRRCCGLRSRSAPLPPSSPGCRRSSCSCCGSRCNPGRRDGRWAASSGW